LARQTRGESQGCSSDDLLQVGRERCAERMRLHGRDKAAALRAQPPLPEWPQSAQPRHSPARQRRTGVHPLKALRMRHYRPSASMRERPEPQPLLADGP
jgi:hypothetical protein